MSATYTLPRWVLPAVVIVMVVLFSVTAAIVLMDDPTPTEALCDDVASLDVNDDEAGFALYADAAASAEEPGVSEDFWHDAADFGFMVSEGEVTDAEAERERVLAEHCGGE